MLYLLQDEKPQHPQHFPVYTGKVLEPSDHLFWVSSWLTPAGPTSCLCWGLQRWMQYFGWVLMRPLSTCWPHFFWFSPGYCVCSGLQVHIARSPWTFCQPAPSIPSPQGCCWAIVQPASIRSWVLFDWSRIQHRLPVLQAKGSFFLKCPAYFEGRVKDNDYWCCYHTGEDKLSSVSCSYFFHIASKRKECVCTSCSTITAQPITCSLSFKW